MFSLGDYDQYLNKLGQFLILVKFGNVKANDDTAKLRGLLKQLLTNDCYFKEFSNFPPSNFGDLQSHRIPYGVLLYCKCCGVDELKAAVLEFDTLKSQYLDNSLFRHIINVSEANCNFDALLDCKFTEETILITKDFDRTVSFAVKNFIADISAFLKTTLNERKALPLEDGNALERTLRVLQFEEKADPKKQRKYINGRWYKHLGDLCFSCGLLVEAEGYFIRAAELLKSSSDPWLAAAKESLVAVSLLNALKAKSLPDVGPITSTTAKQWSQWLSTFEDAANIYYNFRQYHQLYLESLLRLVHLQLLANQKCAAARTLANFANFELLNLSGINRNLLENDQACRYLRTARAFESFAWHRKAAFYYRMAAMRSVKDSTQPSEWVNCHHLLMKAVRGYGLASFSNCHGHTNISGFIQLQSRLLMDLYTASQAFNNYPLALRHACQALDIGGQTLFSYQLSQIFADMRKLSAFSSTLESPIVIDPELVLLPLGSSPYPRLLSVSFHPETISRSTSIIRPTKSLATSSNAAQKTSFIYSPFSHPEKPPVYQPICICIEEEVKLILEIENPFILPVKLDSLVLLTSNSSTSQKDESIEFFSVSEEMLYPGKPKSMVLSCRCHKPGNLLFVGCLVKMSGVTRKILFSDVLSSTCKTLQSKSFFEVEVLPVQLPFLIVKPNCDGDIEINAFLGEVSETYLALDNANYVVQPAVVDLTLKGIPLSVEKALSVTFDSNSMLKVRVDGTVLPSRFSAAFEVTAKFVYSALLDTNEEISDNKPGDGYSKTRYFRSLTFNFRASITAAVYGTVVGIQRRNRQELVLDVKFEHPENHCLGAMPIHISRCNTFVSDSEQVALPPGGKHHMHCLVDNELLTQLVPGLHAGQSDCLDLSAVLKFDWKFLSDDSAQTAIRCGQCSAVVCGSELIGQLKIPPFEASVFWWRTDSGKSASARYDYGKPVTVKLADPVTFLVSIIAVGDLSDARLRLNLDYLPILPTIARTQPVQNVSLPSPPYLISGLACTPSKTMSTNDTLEHVFCLIPSATGRHRVSCDVVTSCGIWPLCPAVFLSCVD